MKKLSLIVLSILFASIFIGFTVEKPVVAYNSLEGVWEMKHQYIYENNQIQDTLFDVNGKRQVKIYSNGKVMWSRYSPKDANEWFGYGSYEIVDGFLEERLEYASNAMMKIVDTTAVFRFELVLEKNSYSQISLDEEGNRYNSENYDRIE
jgi:hypothetical protein